jgi:FAD/FMN-containing dehydrogenase
VGELLRPGLDGYDAARRPEMARFEALRPRAVALCATAADVAQAIAFGRRHELAMAIRSGGHCFAGHSSTDGLLIHVGPMTAVTVSGETVTVGAGTRLGDLYPRLAAQHRAIPGGCGPSVGISGLTLGGGLGILGRTRGLTCDSLIGASVVLADGRNVQCDSHEEPELFWALRGGGPDHFGVVTALRFTTVPAPACTVFDVVWAFEDAAAVLDAWQSWAPDGPDRLAASLLVTASSDPRQAPRVTLFGAVAGPRRDTARLLDQLTARAGVRPRSDWRAELDWLATKRALNERAPGEGEDGDLYQRSGFFRRSLPAEAIGEMLWHVASDRTRGATRELDFTPWGGAYNRVAGDATAFPHRAERFLLKHSTVVAHDAGSAARDDARHWLERSWGAVRAWGTGGVYPNFPDPELEDPGPAYHGANHERLTGIRARYDPEGLFRAARGPAAAGHVR